MKTKNIIIFSIISSFFLVSLISIWKILVTLQGIKLENFNFQIIFLLGFLVSLAHVIIGNKLNYILKLIIFSLIFIFIDGYLIQSMPIWYNIGVFLILYFFINKIFNFLTLFGIVLFSFVILFPFYMMVVTSFKTQIA